MQLPRTRKPTAAVRRHQPATAVHSRLSSFFNGASILDSRPTYRSCSHQIPHSHLPNINTSHFNDCYTNTPPSVLRSRSSTRSLIDPTSSLVEIAIPLTPHTFERYSRCFGVPESALVPSSRLVVRMDLEEQCLTRLRQQNGLRKSRGRKGGPNCFSSAADGGIRRKIFSCLISSIGLALILTTYLALTISHTATGKAFQVMSILLILIITIYFCHSLIRLCMLAFMSPSKPKSGWVAYPVREDGHPQPGPHSWVLTENVEHEEYSNDEGDEEEDLAPPPPVYGLWRGSVLVDPNLIRWQAPEDHKIAERLESPEHGLRPPSYENDRGA